MLVAAQNAQRLNYRQIDTEHILLGLVSESSGAASSVLNKLRLHPVKVAMEVDRLAGWGPGTIAVTMLSRTNGAEAVIDHAIEEAHDLNHDYVGTEHLLMGLLRQEQGVAAHVLKGFGLTTEGVRAEILRVLSADRTQALAEQAIKLDVDPLIEAERKFFLALYRSSIDFYKPRIERRTGVALGDISAWDYSCLHQRVFTEHAGRASSLLVGWLRSLILRRRLLRYAKDTETAYATEAFKCAAMYYRSAIYVSFHSGTPHDEAVAAITVHELSHALWERIEGEHLDAKWTDAKLHGAEDREKYKVFVEGYATYAERVWFADLYPACLRRDGTHHLPLLQDSVYQRGFHRIEGLVQQHGPQILLEIPKLWQRL